MEVKTLLRIIRDDIAHLEAITGEFNQYSLPAPDEIDVALVRANALLRELELLHKFAARHESGYKAVPPAEETTSKVSDHHHSEDEPFELFVQESADDKKIKNLDFGKPDVIAVEYDNGKETITGIKQQFTEYPGVTNDSFEDVASKVTGTPGPAAKADVKPLATKEEVPVEQEVAVTDETAVVEVVIVPNITDQLEEVVAEEFKEEKKTLNETLAEPHKMVNDFLIPDKGETGYQVIPIHSIWDGIGINDQFLFVRELFANNSTKFESTVEAIDQLGSIHEAVNYLKMNFKWNKTEASQKFLVLVKRRFTK